MNALPRNMHIHTFHESFRQTSSDGGAVHTTHSAIQLAPSSPSPPLPSPSLILRLFRLILVFLTLIPFHSIVLIVFLLFGFVVFSLVLYFVLVIVSFFCLLHSIICEHQYWSEKSSFINRHELSSPFYWNICEHFCMMKRCVHCTGVQQQHISRCFQYHSHHMSERFIDLI